MLSFYSFQERQIRIKPSLIILSNANYLGKISNQFVTAFESEEDLLDFNLNTVGSIHNHLFQWLNARLHHVISSSMFSSFLFDVIIAIISYEEHHVIIINCHHLIYHQSFDIIGII